MEQIPAVAIAIAEGMGRTLGELREMARAGNLETLPVIRAIENQAALTAERFKLIRPLVSDMARLLGDSVRKTTALVADFIKLPDISRVFLVRLRLISDAIGGLFERPVSARRGFLNNIEALFGLGQDPAQLADSLLFRLGASSVDQLAEFASKSEQDARRLLQVYKETGEGQEEYFRAQEEGRIYLDAISLHSRLESAAEGTANATVSAQRKRIDGLLEELAVREKVYAAVVDANPAAVAEQNALQVIALARASLQAERANLGKSKEITAARVALAVGVARLEQDTFRAKEAEKTRLEREAAAKRAQQVRSDILARGDLAVRRELILTAAATSGEDTRLANLTANLQTRLLVLATEYQKERDLLGDDTDAKEILQRQYQARVIEIMERFGVDRNAALQQIYEEEQRSCSPTFAHKCGTSALCAAGRTLAAKAG